MHRARWMKNAAIKCLRGNITSEQEITKRKNKQKQKETLRSVEIKKIKHYFENFFLPLKKKKRKKSSQRVWQIERRFTRLVCCNLRWRRRKRSEKKDNEKEIEKCNKMRIK